MDDMDDRLQQLEEALRFIKIDLQPFAEALVIGIETKNAVANANLNKKGLSNLIGISSYAGQHAIESRLSWSDWMCLAEIIAIVGKLATNPEEAAQTSSS